MDGRIAGMGTTVTKEFTENIKENLMPELFDLIMKFQIPDVSLDIGNSTGLALNITSAKITKLQLGDKISRLSSSNFP